MKNLKIVAAVLYGLCIFALNSCINDTTSKNSGPKPILLAPDLPESSIPVRANTLLTPREISSKNLEKIILKNGLIVILPKSISLNNKNITVRKLVEPHNKPGKPYLRALLKTGDKRKIQPPIISNIGILGFPYDSFMNSIIAGKSTCLSDLLEVDIVNPKSDVKFKEFANDYLSSDAVKASLGISAQFVGPVASISALGSFLGSSELDSKSTYIYYIFRYSAAARLKGVNYRDDPRSSFKIDYFTSPKTFREECGDGYVDSAFAGAVLIVRLKLGFSSDIANEEFNLALNGTLGAGLVDITAKITQAMQQTKLKTTLTIEAMQQGGDIKKLPRINQLTSPDSYFYDRPVAISYLDSLGLDVRHGDMNLENDIKMLSAKYELANKYLKYLNDFNSRYEYNERADLLGQLNAISNKLIFQINNVFYNSTLLKECYGSSYPTNLCKSAVYAANAQLDKDDVKLQESEVQLLTDFLPHQQFSVGGIGLWRGNDLGIGICHLIPVTMAQDKDVLFHLDCGLGNDNPADDILANLVTQHQIIIDDFSYGIGQPEVKVKCLA
ncbi:MAG: hypothetical protein K0R49_114, partial [Burkholderiales bacterium]|nr:hypothetical protein [Burkholderiales bacterium]